MLRESDLANAKRLEELFEQDLTGMSRNPIPRQHQIIPSVVIGDFDIVCVSRVPAEDQSPLVVDPNAVFDTRSFSAWEGFAFEEGQFVIERTGQPAGNRIARREGLFKQR
jgi:hypothetical protein